MNITLKHALGNKIIIETVDKVSVLKSEETATVFKVVSIGSLSEYVNNMYLSENDLIVVAPGSVEKAVAEGKNFLFVRDTDVVAVVEDGS